MRGKKMDKKIKLTHAGINAANHCLLNTQVSKRGDLRRHSKILKGLVAQCTEKKTQVINGQAAENTVTKEGFLIIDEECLEFLQDSADAKLEAGVPGTIAEGYNDLLDAMDSAEKADQPATPIEEKK